MFVCLICYRRPVYVPTGFAAFPDELVNAPVYLAELKYRHIIHHSIMSRGGHFAAMEQPQLLNDHIRQFVHKREP